MKKILTSERIPIKLWLDDIEEGALKQAKNLANLHFAFKWIAIMPDCHQGFGMPIGGVMATNGVIVPNAVGVDIGCGMYAAKTSLTDIDGDTIRVILRKIREVVPLGFEHHKENQKWDGFDHAPDISIIQNELFSARKQLGTLGGGNHFIEIQNGSDGYIWIMLHSGSRNFGLKTAEHFHKKAQLMCNRMNYDIPHKDLAYLPIETSDGKEYFEAMKYCSEFAKANRALMMRNISKIFTAVTGSHNLDEINIHHNYAALENHFGKNVIVHRKGATKASTDTIGIIPGSMGSYSYIVKGLGNPESFHSCSHGAGRKMGRREAERSLNLEAEQNKLDGIIHGLRSKKGLDEAPGAYKDIEEVMENQKDLVEILITLKPLGSIKA
ncbi:MAG: RtcB family protein [Anaerolinea sp.]|nr:RtcB family protein [Anaerolinea sp.]